MLKKILTFLKVGTSWSKTPMDYSRQLQFIRALHLPLGKHLRMDCPSCGGRYTFSVTNAAGVVLWHCFKDSCKLAGSDHNELSKDQIVEVLEKVEDEKFATKWIIPSYFQPIKLLPGSHTYEYLNRHNCIEAYRCDLFQLMHDPQMDRIVFIKFDKLRPIIGIGKSILEAQKPKWYKYNSTDVPFIINRGSDVGVIVEDVPSAATVALGGFGGIALMGTKFLPEYTVPILKQFRHLVIALDPDAAKTSLEIQKKLNYIIPTTIHLSKLDLKWFKPKDIHAQLKDVI